MSQDFLSREEVNLLFHGVTTDDWAKAMEHQENAGSVPRMSEKSDYEMTIQDWIKYYEYELQQCDEYILRNEAMKRQIRSFLNVLRGLEKK